MRIAAKPTIAMSEAKAIIAHSDKVGMLAAAVPKGAHEGTVMAVLVAVVTVEPYASALPIKVEAVPNVMLRPAPAPRKTFPTKLAFAPIVVPPLGAQKTSDWQAPLAMTTLVFAIGSSAPPGLKM